MKQHRLNTYSPENVQAQAFADAVQALNVSLGIGAPPCTFVSADGTELVGSDGHPFTADGLAVAVRALLEPGFVEDDDWKPVAAIPRGIVRAYLTTPSMWAGLPTYAATADTGWTPVPLDMVDSDPEKPLVGERVDGVALFYRNKVNVVFGDSEGGKTWLCLLAAAQELRAGRTVCYIDYEDSPRGIKSRLMDLGVPEDVLNDPSSFIYLNPFGPIGRELEDEAVQERLQVCSLVVVDAMTEALSAAGLNSNADVEVAHWFNTFGKPMAKLGPAVVLIDHAPKAANNKAQQTGSQHKKSAVDGSQVAVINKKPFRPGAAGYSVLEVRKDRPGGVRAKSVEGKLFGQLRMDDTGPGSLRIDLPNAASGAGEDQLDSEAQKTALHFIIGGIIDSLEASGEKVTVRNIKAEFREQGHTGKTEDIEEAIRSVKASRPVPLRPVLSPVSP